MKRHYSSKTLLLVKILLAVLVIIGIAIFAIDEIFNDKFYVIIIIWVVIVIVFGIFYYPLVKQEQDNKKKEINNKVYIYSEYKKINLEKVEYNLNNLSTHTEKINNILVFVRNIILDNNVYIFMISDNVQDNPWEEMKSIYKYHQETIAREYSNMNAVIGLGILKQSGVNEMILNKLLDISKESVFDSIDREETKFVLDENYVPPLPPIFVPVLYDTVGYNLYYIKGLGLNCTVYRKAIRILFKHLK